MSFLGNLVKGATDFIGSATGIGTMLNAGVGILGNMMSSNNQNSANKTNLQIAQMNNEFNERMLDKQMKYNSLSNQVQQAKDAGLNPYLALGNAGQVGSTASAAASPSVQPYRWDMSSVGNAIQAGIQQSKQNEMLTQQIEGLRIENQYRKQAVIKELANLDEQNLGMRAKRSIDEITAKSLDELNRSVIANNYASEKEKLQNVDESIARMLLNRAELRRFDEKFDYQKSLAVAQTLRLGAQRKLDEQQLVKEVYNTITAMETARLTEQERKNYVAMSHDIVEAARINTEWLPWEKGLNAILGTAREAREWIPKSKSKGYTRQGWSSTRGSYYESVLNL